MKKVKGMGKATVLSLCFLEYCTRCHTLVILRICGMLMRCCGFVEKKLYGDKLLQFTIFLREKI
jgi:hypothetical protein